MNSLVNRNLTKKTFLFIIIGLLMLMMGSLAVLANENKVTVLASTLNVRFGPGLSHEILTQVHEEDQLTILGEENQWYRVRSENNEIGWVASWLVENEEVSVDNRIVGRITANEVNVRQFSSTDSAVIGTVFLNDEFQILYSENDWIQILYNNRVAWIHENYIERTNDSLPEQQVEQDSDKKLIKAGMNPTNLRAEPNTDSAILATLTTLQEFTVLEEENEWYMIELEDGTQAYIASWLTEPAETVDQPVEPDTSSAYVATLAEATIVIDAGHGGKDPGAVAPDGSFVEADIALSTSLHLANRLQNAGANVILTRSDDTFLSLNDRVYYAHRAQADAFISIHYDAVEIPNSMSGTTTYYHSETEKELAESINHFLTQNGPLRNNGVRQADFFVLRNNGQKAVLLELGYMNHDFDISLINTDHYHQTIADAIFQGMSEYFRP
ncbi:N-acetylmuramoyl-L-alanine amidase [Alkalibacterium sp.]|nr:MAG: N-acetylmuramoyl-L-alanine amidase [Alkalibacterium sp.]